MTASRIGSRIDSGVIRLGVTRVGVTIKDVAREAGVSMTTVSLVLSNKGSFTPQTRARVRSIARGLGYVRRPLGGVIALLGWVPVEFQSAFRFASAEYGLTLRYVQCSDGLCDTLRREMGTQVSGLLIHGGQWHPDQMRTLGEAYPCVLLGTTLPNESVDAIWVDNVGAIQRATEHLVAHGHRYIGLLNGPDDSFASAEKDLGFRVALRHADGVGGCTIYSKDFSQESGRRATVELLDGAPHITALIAGERTLGQAALHVADARGLSVPRDLSLVVYRDAEAFTTSVPPLTAIDTPYLEIAREAVSHLVSRIHHTSACGRRLLLKPRLVVRESVTRPRPA